MSFAMKMTPNHHFMLNGLPLEPVSRTYQYRKIMKPMLERKRRARINKCLDELKDLMTGTLQAQDGENVSKLEKADILELTVRHLHKLRESNALFLRRNETISMDKFWAGFQHCAAEVSQFLNKYDRSISGDLIKYIANYIPSIAATAAVANAAATATSTAVVSTACRREQERLQAYANQFPLNVGKPSKPLKYDAPSAYEQRRRHATTTAGGNERLHPYARNAVSTDETLSDGDSDGDSASVWRPW